MLQFTSSYGWRRQILLLILNSCSIRSMAVRPMPTHNQSRSTKGVFFGDRCHVSFVVWEVVCGFPSTVHIRTYVPLQNTQTVLQYSSIQYKYSRLSRAGFGKILLQYKYTVYCIAVYRILRLSWAVYRNTAAQLAVALRCTGAQRKYGTTAAPCSSILQPQENTTVFAVFQSLLLDFQYCASKVLGTRSANKRTRVL
jgi:hypothetical protein